MAQGAATANGRRRGNAVRLLFGDRSYRSYFVASATFALGIWAFITAMGWSALELTDSAFRVSLVNVVYFLPMFLFALPSGVLADAVDRRRNVLWSRGGSGLLVAIMTLMAATERLTFAWLCIFSFGVGLSVISELAARQALVAQIVPVERLVGATALTSVQGGVARVVGPLLAGGLIDRLGPGGGYGLFVATTVLFLLAFQRVEVKPVDRAGTRRPGRELLEGFRYLRGHRDALAIVTTSVLAGTVGWLHLALLPVMARDVLGGDAVTLGVLATAVGLGSIPGSVGLGLAGHVRREGRLYVASMLTWGTGILAFGLARTFGVALVALCIVGLGFGLQTVLTRSLLLRIVEPAYHGRILGTLMLTYGANVIGTLAGGRLAEAVGTPLVVGASGASIVLTTLVVVGLRPRLVRL